MQKNIFTRLTLLSLFICLLTSNIQAEFDSDSLRQIWDNQSEADSSRFRAIDDYFYAQVFDSPDSAFSLAQYHYALAEQKNTNKERAKALNNQALAFYVLGEADSAMSLMIRALDIVAGLNDDANLARQYVNIGNIYRNQSKYQEAVRYYSLGLAILEEKKMEAELADVLNNLGLVYDDIDRLDLALDYLTQALRLYQKLGIEDKMGNIWLNIGAVYFKKGDSDLALENAKKALKILQTDNNSFSVANTYRLMAQIYHESGRIDSALHYIHQSLSINQAIGNEVAIIDNRILLGNLIFVDDIVAATKIGEEVLAFAEGKAGHEWKRDVYQLLHRCYKAQKKYRLSLEMNEKYKMHSDSVLSEINDIAIIREAIQAEFERELLRNKLEAENTQAQLKLDQLKERYGMILIGLVTIGLILFYVRNRTIAHRKQQAALLSEIERLKNPDSASIAIHGNGFQLDKAKIEKATARNINETDWKVLNLLLDDPVISNKEIAAQAFMSVDGIGSSLRRMYSAFEIKESKYKKISLLIEAIKLSNS
ncbi:MAG: tetratricopeptide repeat protein [Bacteroidia bacterium]